MMMQSTGRDVFKSIFFDISGKCQAKCPHCCTGNRSLQSYTSRFIPLDEFTRAIDRLLNISLADSTTQFELYNWGEPFLHPKLTDLLRVLSERSLRYRISTNGGKYRSLPPYLTKNMTQLTITLPGFSQASYDRVHGFDFKKILENINRFRNDIGEKRLRITYLVHQFNLDEIRKANEYFSRQKIRLTPTIAYLNDYNLSRDYLKGTLDPQILARIGKDLLLWYVDELLKQRPTGYSCPQFSILAVDEFCRVLTCCQVPKGHPDYSLGSLFDMTAEQILIEKKRRHVCGECQKLGIDYWIHTSPAPKFWGHITGEGIQFFEGCRTLARYGRLQVAHMVKIWKKKLS